MGNNQQFTNTELGSSECDRADVWTFAVLVARVTYNPSWKSR